ncbi:MAG: hypothetical protein HZA06_04210 [Nitrospirae bacterium]|nr:hypothetical protein [Nitrospirota bacterium]
METHVVRIYRYEKNNPKRLVGIVETIGEEGEAKKAFTNLDELWKILNPARENLERRRGEGEKGET